MTSNINFIKNIMEIKPILNRLSCEKIILARKGEQVTLSHDIMLRDALYILNLTRNLILVGRLCEDLDCDATFRKYCCVILDHILSSLIGLAELRGRVYHHSGSFFIV